jgi:hypothetical protein
MPDVQITNHREVAEVERFAAATMAMAVRTAGAAALLQDRLLPSLREV